MARNPLRVLDSKRDSEQALISEAPTISSFLSPAAAEHFEAVQSGLRLLGIPFVIDERLVRGLDYYCRTTFEFSSTALESAQTAVGGGGRYDGLVEDLGGPQTPGIGFAIGVDRTLLACDAEGAFAAPSRAADVFVVDTTGGQEALVLCTALRHQGIRVERAYGGRSMKAQMKVADKSGARVAIIIGEDELQKGVASVRLMNGGGQEEIVLSEVVEHVRKVVL